MRFAVTVRAIKVREGLYGKGKMGRKGWEGLNWSI